MSDTLPNPELVAALPRLRRYARVLIGDVNCANDLVQDTLARAWEKRRLWRAGSDLRAWLFTIMHNVHVNQYAERRGRHGRRLGDFGACYASGSSRARRGAGTDQTAAGGATRGADSGRSRGAALRGNRSRAGHSHRHRNVA